MQKPGRPLLILVALLSLNLLLAGTVLTDSPVLYASHDGEGDPDAVANRAIALVVDAEPTLARVHEPNVPDDCWTIQEFPYTRDAYFTRKAECVEPWITTHQMFTFEVEAGGTYVLWNELLAPSMPAQFFPPTTEVFVELQNENRWLSMNAPLVDLDNQVYGHLPSSRWIEDLSVLARWGWDDDVHIDYRTPTEEGIRNRIAYAFTAKEDGLWRFNAGGTNPLPPGTYDAGDNLRVWIQRLDGGGPESMVFVFERFEYPPANELVIEHGATVYREFEVTERDTAELATNLSVTLSPTGSCSSLDPGRMRCTINTAEIPVGPTQFRFTSATHNGEPESTADWPSFGFTTVERDIKTKAEMKLGASAKGQIAVGLFFAGESGIGIEFGKNDSLTLESSESVAIGVTSDVGVGGGVKLGWVSPRAKAEIEGEVELKAFETVTIDINDPGNFDQQLAMSAFLFEKVVALGGTLTEGSTQYILDAFREDVLVEQYKEFIGADEFGIAGSAKLTGKLGAFTANRPGQGVLSYGLGVTANGAISASWKFDKKTGNHAIVLKVSAAGVGVLSPQLIPLYFEGEVIDYTATGGIAAEVVLGFNGFPSEETLETVTFNLKGGTTWSEQIQADSLSITFDAKDLAAAGSQIIDQVLAIADPRNTATITAEVLNEVFGEALKEVNGTLTITETQGTGFTPAVAVGAELLAGFSLKGEAEAGAEWVLAVTEKTQDWRLLVDSDGRRGLVQIADFPFEETEASEKQFTDIVDRILLEALEEHLPGASFREWVKEQWNSGEELSLDAPSDRTETAELRISNEPREVRDALQGEVLGLEIGIRTWFGLVLPDWVVPGGALDTESAAENFQIAFRSDSGSQAIAPDFYASEFMDVGPFDVTVDPAVEISLSYLSGSADPDDLLLYRHIGDGIWQPLPTQIDAVNRVATAQITEFGTFVVGLDTTPPEILTVQTPLGFTAVVVDGQSGIDADSITMSVDGTEVETQFDAATGIVTPVEPVRDGDSVELTVADMSGNEATQQAEVTELPADESESVNGGGGTSTNSTPQATSTSTSTSQVILNPGGGDADEGSDGGSPVLIIILIVLALLAGAGGAAFYFVRKQGQARPA